MSAKLHRNAFTIVELLIVIVVISIIATLSIVAYSSTTQKATVSSIQADLTNAKKQLLAFQASSTTNSFPTAINCNNPSATEICLKSTGSNTYTYNVNNSNSPPTFNLTSTNGTTKYWINDSSNILTTPDIVTSGLVLNLDAANPQSYPGTGTTWTDLSGNNNNGTLMNGVGYSSGKGGALIFDGINDYVNVPDNVNLQLNNYTLEAWVYPLNNSNSGHIIRKEGSYILSHYWTSGQTTGIWMQRTGGWESTHVTDNPTLNNWLYVTGTYDNNNVTIYKNSISVTNTTKSGQTRVTTNPILINGAVSNSVPQNYICAVIRIYNRALTPSEITQNFNALRGRYGI